MKLGLGLYGNMLTADNFRFAKQCGATHIVAHIVGHFKKPDSAALTTEGSPLYGFGVSDPMDGTWTYEWFRDLKAAVNAEGLELEAIENFEPAHWYDVLLDGPKRDAQMAHLKQIIRDMGRAGIPIMGYNFSLAGVWGRDHGPFARGHAVSVGYHHAIETPIPKGMVWNMVYDTQAFDPIGRSGVVEPITHEQLWDRFERFLKELLPVAEEAGVKLALHPDDPPLPTLRGTPRLVYRWDSYQRVLDLAPSPYNAMEFCLGTLAEMSDRFGSRDGFANIYDMVDRYSATGRIGYIHFRNVRGQVPTYEEVFVDEGDVDMIAVLRVLHKNNFEGVLIPDHTPQMSCPAPWHAGMAFALGFMRAAIQMIEREGRGG
ncbi:MAG: mannonate dehydratase [Anaerolineae bacterium]|nr:mannonate dehydratase [Anaerolineae bacterium]